MPSMLCTVATPTRELYSGYVEYAEVPGVNGNFGVMKGHEMFVTTNRSGIVTLWLDKDGKDTLRFAVQEGATQVYNDRITVLARFGVAVDGINVDEVKAKADKLRAEIEEVSQKGDGFDESAIEPRKAHLAWYETQIKIAEGALK